MFWWAICAGSVGFMLGFGFAAMLAAGKRADIESALVEAHLAAASWQDQHASLKYAFETLCRAMVKVGLGTTPGAADEGGKE